MRIISGRFRSRRLQTPRDAETTRPIPDRVKESLFAMLQGNCQNAQVVDAFAGTGSIGLEALSRGARHVVFIERDRRAGDMLQENIDALGVGDEVDVVRADALGPATLNRCPEGLDLVFFDPPYPLVLDPVGWDRVKRQLERLAPRLNDDGLLVLRTPWPFRWVELVDAAGEPLPAHERAKFDLYGRRLKNLPPPVRMPRDRSGEERSDRPRGKRSRGRSSGRSRDEDDAGVGGRREWIGDDIDIDEIQAMSEAELESVFDQEEASSGVKAIRTDVPLALEGTIGPETHPYGSMAVHLYQRAN